MQKTKSNQEVFKNFKDFPTSLMMTTAHDDKQPIKGCGYCKGKRCVDN